MRLTAEQALAKLLPSGKSKAKGKDALKHVATFGVADDNIYVFGNSQGGVMTAAIDTLPLIVGSWEEGGDEMPPALKDMINEYADEVEWWERCGEDIAQESQAKAPAKAKAAPRQSISKMIETKWSQGSPYNDMCIFEGKRCSAGCNAIATAQIMFHWKNYHRGCKPTEAYTTSTNKYKVEAWPAKIVFDYNNLVAKPKTSEQKKAVAELIAYLGRTFHSNYTPNGTGAYTHKVAEYLKDNFRMGGSISYITAQKLGVANFESVIYNELLNGRPVMVGGYLDSGSGGHAFIIDGYDADTDMYHVNWGWGGSYDGWFKITTLNATSSYHFNSKKDAIIGIQPEYKLGDVNGDGNIDIADATQVINEAMAGRFSEQADINSDGQVTVTDAQLVIDKILGVREL